MHERRARLNIDWLLNHDALELYGIEGRVFLRKKRGESMRHVAMKLLSYFLFYRTDLEIESSANQHYKPDLVRFDERLDPTLWIDCGSTKIRKLEDITQKNRDCSFVIVKPDERSLINYWREAHTRLEEHAEVRFVSFGDDFVYRLADRLNARHTMRVTVSGDWTHLYVTLDGEDLRTTIIEIDEASEQR